MYVDKKSRFFNEDKNTQKKIRFILEKLEDRLKQFDDMNKIFNNDALIYDRINKELFIFKSSGNIQYRFVYGYKNKELYLVDYICKKKNNKKYINELGVKYSDKLLEDFDFEKI